MAVTNMGRVLISWYDRRNNTPDLYDYEYWGVLSTDNGASWQNNDTISDQIIPEPVADELDPCFAGDYNYHSTFESTAYVAWTDGRVFLPNNAGTPVPQQDVFFDKVDLGGGSAPTPAVCTVNGNYAGVEASDTILHSSRDIDNHCDDCVTLIDLPFPFMLYDQSYSRAYVSSNGNLQFTDAPSSDAHYPAETCTLAKGSDVVPALLPFWADLQTDGTVGSEDLGVYTSIIGDPPNRVFNIEWRARQCIYTRNSRNSGPPVCNNYRNFAIKLYEGQPEGLSKFEFVYGATSAGAQASVGVQGEGFLTSHRCDDAGRRLRQGRKITFTRIPGTCQFVFTDVQLGSTFYPYVRCLTCQYIIGGYPCGSTLSEPCDCNNNPYFRPNTDVTRGQLSKIVSESAGFQEDPGDQIYDDVPETNEFFKFINRLTNRNIVSGFICDLEKSASAAPFAGRCFGPNRNATRGQTSKIVSNAAGFTEPVSGQMYTDVPPGSAFYEWIMRLSLRGIVGGYPCGTNPNEPCEKPPRPYFRPNSYVTRGQSSKMVSQSFFPGCQPSMLGPEIPTTATAMVSASPIPSQPAQTAVTTHTAAPSSTVVTTPTRTPGSIPTPVETVRLPFPIPTGPVPTVSLP
ncbi:MAG TPA: S-layer homology domain-containing protein [Chloroflexia bacterium]